MLQAAVSQATLFSSIISGQNSSVPILSCIHRFQDVNLAEMPHYFVAPAFDINVGNAVRQLGTFDLGQSYALQTLCGSGDVVIDVGHPVQD